jgi:hypothetical protein
MVEESADNADDLWREASVIARNIGGGFTGDEVARLARDGKLPCFKIGGVWCMRRKTFERYCAEREVMAA